LKRHVDFLATLYVAWGAIFALVAIAGFALAGGAFAIAQSTGPVRFSSEMAARLTGVTISIIAVIALVWAILHLVVGRQLKKYRPSARLMTLGLAVGNLILLPFGTALGVYALWVLLKDEGRRLFEPGT
jgi:threonine/homoserine efflux transporter RhtA